LFGRSDGLGWLFGRSDGLGWLFGRSDGLGWLGWVGGLGGSVGCVVSSNVLALKFRDADQSVPLIYFSRGNLSLCGDKMPSNVLLKN